MKLTRILILEDDLETLSILLGKLHELEEELIAGDNKNEIAVTVFSEYTQVEDHLNKITNPNFDVILLDRDCKMGGSFHVLDITKFDSKKIISISSIPQYNEDARKSGITNIVHKDYKNLERFSNTTVVSILKLISNGN